MTSSFREVLDKGHGEMDVRFRHFKTGQALWMAYKVLTTRRRSAGRPVAIATVSQDVTERRRLEDDLREPGCRSGRSRIAARMNSLRRSPTSCAIRWRP